MRAFRIADRRFPIFNGTGAQIVGGRWNSPGHAVIYAAESFAGAMLEILVHANLQRIPKTYAYIEIAMPETVHCERLSSTASLIWETENQESSRAFGDQWIEEARSSVLIVPSVVTGGVETNILINPLHPDFSSIVVIEPREVLWDSRFFEEKRSP